MEAGEHVDTVHELEVVEGRETHPAAHTHHPCVQLQKLVRQQSTANTCTAAAGAVVVDDAVSRLVSVASNSVVLVMMVHSEMMRTKAAVIRI